MFNAKTELENKAYRQEQEAQAQQAALKNEAQAGKVKGNLLQAVVKFAKSFGKESEQAADDYEAQESPAVELKPRKADS